MKIKAEQKFIRTSPRKLRLVADVVRGLGPQEAIRQLEIIRKNAALPLAKVIKQAIANASNNLQINQNSLQISSIEINEGPTFKRWQAVSRGRAHSILKRTSHIKVVLETSATPNSISPAPQTDQPTTTKTKPAKKTAKSKTNN